MGTSHSLDRPGLQVFPFLEFAAGVLTHSPRIHFLRLLAKAAVRSVVLGVLGEESAGCLVLQMVPLCALSSSGYRPANDNQPPPSDSSLKYWRSKESEEERRIGEWAYSHFYI